MSTEPYLGEIKIFAFNYAPPGYLACAGQLMSISQNSALFAILGVAYGGDGQNTFGLPDLRSRMPIGVGQGPGLSSYVIGQRAGTETTTLLQPNLPAHNHTLNAVTVKLQASSANADESSPDGTFLATPATPMYAATETAGIYTGKAVLSGTTDLAGGNQPISLMTPYLAVYYAIATSGIFPSRP